MRQQTLRSAIKDRPESGDAAAAAAFARSRTGPDTTGGVRGRMLFEDDPPAAGSSAGLSASVTSQNSTVSAFGLSLIHI